MSMKGKNACVRLEITVGLGRANGRVVVIIITTIMTTLIMMNGSVKLLVRSLYYLFVIRLSTVCIFFPR